MNKHINLGMLYSISKIANIYFTMEHRCYKSTRYFQSYSSSYGINTGLQRHLPILQLLPLRLTIFKTPVLERSSNKFILCSNIRSSFNQENFKVDCQQSSLANPYADNSDRAKEWWDYSQNIIQEKIGNNDIIK